MKLSQYLVLNGISQKRFAADLGVCQATIHKYLYEKSCPSGKRMMQIYKQTEGAVNLEDWIDHFDIGGEDGESVKG
jgi:predicted transcriptional regulator